MAMKKLSLLLLSAILSALPLHLAARQQLTMSRDVLLDKIKGGWAGQTIGCAFGGGDVTGDQLYRNADSALYAVKESGRSGCEFYGEGTGEAAGADKADRGPAAEQGNAEAGEGE